MRDVASFGQRIYTLRKEKGFTQPDFAAYLGIALPTLRTYEKSISEPTMGKLVIIANKCNVSVDWLCGMTEIRNVKIDFTRFLDMLQALEPEQDDWTAEKYRDHL